MKFVEILSSFNGRKSLANEEIEHTFDCAGVTKVDEDILAVLDMIDGVISESEEADQ